MFLVEATQRIMKIARIRKWFVPRNFFENPGRNFSVRDTRPIDTDKVHSFIQDHVRIPEKSVKIYKDLNPNAHIWIKDRREDLSLVSFILHSECVYVYVNTLYSFHLFRKNKRKTNKLW